MPAPGAVAPVARDHFEQAQDRDALKKLPQPELRTYVCLHDRMDNRLRHWSETSGVHYLRLITTWQDANPMNLFRASGINGDSTLKTGAHFDTARKIKTSLQDHYYDLIL